MSSLMKKLTVRKSKSAIENQSNSNSNNNTITSSDGAQSTTGTSANTETTNATTKSSTIPPPLPLVPTPSQATAVNTNANGSTENSPTAFQTPGLALWSPPSTPINTVTSQPIPPPHNTSLSGSNSLTSNSSASTGHYTNTIHHPDPSRVSAYSKTLREFRDTIRKIEAKGYESVGLALPDAGTLASVVDAIKHSDDIDDRKFLLEHILNILSKLSPTSEIGKHLSNFVVQLLYHDLQHPPATYLSNKYAWRSADGSFNNINIPDLGKSFTPYARSVQQVHPLPASEMPDAGLVFDALLKRRDGTFTPHPAGLSSLMFNFAALVIHTCFRTSHTDWSVNETTSYVDLSPLYGVNQEQQDKVRDKSGLGLLKNDTFAEDRLLLLPPAVCVLLVLFNRNHNYIATQLLHINERQSYTSPHHPNFSKLTPKDIEKQDESLFQTARLINCGWFASVVFSDYFTAILGLVRQGSSWSLDPFEEIRTIDHDFVGRGEGNAVSVEFNCLYRWHATTSVADEEWNQKLFQQVFKDKTYDSVTPQDFRIAAKELQATEPDCTHWTFGGLQRQENGKFNDSELGAILVEATSKPAHAFGARSTPPVMRLNEIMGIEQARKWGVCSLNDFRQYLGLKRYESFEEWNPDPEIAFVASKLYGGDVNNLELYVGLQAEETKPVIPGAGLCPGYTISRAILADAIALTRGDRFFTTDMTPYNYTAWGLKDCTKDPTSPGLGSMLGKLFLRTLGTEYVSNSVYTWFPLHTPNAIEGFLKALPKELGMVSRYSAERPQLAPKLVVVKEYKVVRDVLYGVKERFRPVYADRVGAVVKGHGFFLASETDSTDSTAARALLVEAPESLKRNAAYLENKLRWLLEKDSYYLANDGVRNFDAAEVLKCVLAWWVAGEVAGVSLRKEGDKGLEKEKEKEKDGKLWTDRKFHEMLRDIYSFIFFESDPAHEINLEERAKKASEDILKLVKASLKPSGGNRLSIIDTIQNALTTIEHKRKSDNVGENDLSGAHVFMEGLQNTGKNTDELANTILSVAVGSSVELSQAMINMINLYLGHQYTAERSKIEDLITKGDAESETLLMGYAREALRLDPPFVGVYREARENCQIGDLAITTSERLFLSIYKANRDETIFPNPHTIDPTRPVELYILGDGPNTCLGAEFSYKMMAQVLRIFFSLKNLRRAPGVMGKLKRYPYTINGTDYYQYLNKSQVTTPWATTLYLQFDS